MLEKGWIYNMIKEIKTKLSSFEIFTIFRNEENSFILDSAMDKKKLGRFSFISSNPFKVLKYKNTLNNPLDNLQEELKKIEQQIVSSKITEHQAIIKKAIIEDIKKENEYGIYYYMNLYLHMIFNKISENSLGIIILTILIITMMYIF